MIFAISICILLFTVWVIGGYVPTMNIEMPTYGVIEKKPDYEIRQYESFVIAETGQIVSHKDSVSSGFNELFRYISGNNAGSSKISMTAPVLRSTEVGGEKIPMSGPVIKQGAGGSGTIAFVMPPGSSVEDLPQPRSTKVALKVVRPHKVAVIRFSGYAAEKAIKAHTTKLLLALERDGRHVRSAPYVALYNPPWTPPFMRRNEVMVELDQGGEQEQSAMLCHPTDK